jgi:hypothetical protein
MMKKWEIFVLALHALAYVLWFWDSKTIEAWKTRRRYWAALEEEKKYSDGFMDEIYDYIELHESAHKEEREKQKKQAMDRHPTSYKPDNETLARLARDEMSKKRKNPPRTRPANMDFWPMFDEWDK